VRPAGPVGRQAPRRGRRGAGGSGRPGGPAAHAHPQPNARHGRPTPPGALPRPHRLAPQVSAHLVAARRPGAVGVTTRPGAHRRSSPAPSSWGPRRSRTAGQRPGRQAPGRFPGGGRACVCNRPLSGAPGPRTPPGGPKYALSRQSSTHVPGSGRRSPPSPTPRRRSGRGLEDHSLTRIPSLPPEPAAGHVPARERFWPAPLPRRLPPAPATAVVRRRTPPSARQADPGRRRSRSVPRTVGRARPD
jgi:hypothetical protein